MLKRLVQFFLLISIGSILCGCSGEELVESPAPPKAYEKTYTAEVPLLDPKLTVRENMTLATDSDRAIVVRHEGTGELSFTSYDEAIVTVTSGGMLSGIRPGEAVVSVKLSEDGTYRSWSKNISVRVTAPDIRKSIFLTFDDGPSDNITPQLLDMLKNHGVHATFFVIGTYAEEYPEIVKRAYDEGHTIAIHTYTHDYHDIYASVDAYIEDFNRTEALLMQITGEKPRFWRFPGGGGNHYVSKDTQREIVEILHQRGYTSMDWTVSSTDAAPDYPSAQTMIQKASEGIDMMIGAHRTPVVLMHDSEVKVSAPEVAARLIEHYEALGYNFRPLDDYYGEDMTFIKK